MDASKIIVVEYSKSQNALHRETLQDLLNSNYKALAEKRTHDFHAILTSDSIEESEKELPEIKAGLAKIYPDIATSTASWESANNG